MKSLTIGISGTLSMINWLRLQKVTAGKARSEFKVTLLTVLIGR